MAFFAEEFGKAFVFKGIRPKIRSFMMKAGYDDVPYEMFGFLFYGSILVTYFVFILLVFPRIKAVVAGNSNVSMLMITFISWVIIQTIVLIMIVTYIYLSLNIKIYQRTKDIEKILPDYLQLVSSNLRGGLSFEKALWAAIRPEFGTISKEVTMVYKKVMTGNDTVPFTAANYPQIGPYQYSPLISPVSVLPDMAAAMKLANDVLSGIFGELAQPLPVSPTPQGASDQGGNPGLTSRRGFLRRLAGKR